jgi:hypothetical protein
VKTKKKKHLEKNSLYYTEKNFNFVRVFCKILYTLFTFDFTIEKIPLYNTEKNSGFVDVFWEKFINCFQAKEKSSPCRQGLSISFYNLDI